MQRFEVTLEDDLTGGLADETVQFGLDGRGYEVDLTTRHAADFRRQLALFVEHARLIPAQRSRRRSRRTTGRQRSHQIRAWAEEHGFAIAERGRLPGNVVQEYDIEHRAELHTERRTQRESPSRSVRSPRGSAKTPARVKPAAQRRRKSGGRGK